MPDCLPKTSMTVPHKSNLTYFKTKPMLISTKHTFDDWLVLLAPSLPQHTEHRDKGVYKTTRHQGPWIPLAHILPCLSQITPAFPQSTTPLKLNTILLLYYLKSSVIPHSLNMTFKCIKDETWPSKLPSLLSGSSQSQTTSHIADLLPLQTVSFTFSETLTPFLLLLSSHWHLLGTWHTQSPKEKLS